MEIYLLYIVGLLLFSAIDVFCYKNKSLIRSLFAIEFLMLSFLGGLRKNVGVDYVTYRELFSMPDFYIGMKEKGFIHIIEFFHFMDFSFSFFIFLFAFLSVWLAFRFIFHNSPYILFSILVYFSIGNFYFSTFNVIRQALATVIFLNLLPLIERKQFGKYAIILLLTSYFIHATALFLIPLYFFLRKDWNLFLKIILAGVVIMFSSLLIYFVESSSYAIYLSFDNFATAVPLTFYLIAIWALLIFFYSLKNPNWRRKNVIFSNLNYLTLLLICLLFIYENTPLVMVINRILGYFTMIYVVLLPMVLVDIKLENLKRFIIIGFSLVFGLLSYWALSENGIENQMLPYTSIFN